MDDIVDFANEAELFKDEDFYVRIRVNFCFLIWYFLVCLCFCMII
jgi:hypothetical protein